ncbi:MAG TPA: tRNA 2-selenouridine(34) synthase MnmH [Chitinophagaceae bacterium]|nr:tRNA 2-selenouridine(34) synthase MnmH [Chitinophagaceae bacterium]
MGIEKIHIGRFLELAENFPVLDVRSPSEYNHAHIPGAVSLPLFTDEERKIVGTAYKQQSRKAAIKIGLDFFGPKMRAMVEAVEKIMEDWPGKATTRRKRQEDDFAKVGHDADSEGKSRQAMPVPATVLVHCWRGGMRSAGVAWLLDLYGFKVYTLIGGYKAFRNWVLKQFTEPYRLNILGGFTGSGKTEVLAELRRMQEVTIDLEALAGHKGSAFGNIGLPAQPTQEMFENKLALALQGAWLAAQSSDKPIWLEDESQRIGTVNIPQPLWSTMRSSPIYFLDIPFKARLEHIVAEYGALDKQKVLEAIARLQKRLGGLETKTAVQYLTEENVRECFRILLSYYDKYYQKALNNRNNLASLLSKIPCSGIQAAGNAMDVLKKTQSISVE